MKTIKSTLVKLLASFAMAFALVATVNNAKSADTVFAATTPSVVTVNYKVGWSIAVWDNYNDGKPTGQYLKYNTSWKVIETKTAKDGSVWYDLGNDQWVPAKYVMSGYPKKAVSQAPVSGAEAAAKAWIAQRESGNNYNARNGIYIGKYQLTASYLGGDYSPANQERVANNYVKSRYGSWVNAKNFWLSHGWY